MTEPKKWVNSRALYRSQRAQSVAAGVGLTLVGLLNEIRYDSMSDEERAQVLSKVYVRLLADEGVGFAVRAVYSEEGFQVDDVSDVDEALAWEAYVQQQMAEHKGQSRRTVGRRLRMSSFLAGYRAGRSR